MKSGSTSGKMLLAFATGAVLGVIIRNLIIRYSGNYGLPESAVKFERQRKAVRSDSYKWL
jgi:hypothetical protein